LFHAHQHVDTNLSISLDHYIVRVSISYAKHIGGHAVACTAERELVDGFVQFVGGLVVLFEPTEKRALLERRRGGEHALFLLYVGNGFCVAHHLDHAQALLHADAVVDVHAEVHTGMCKDK